MCKCQQNSQFKTKLREAFSQNTETAKHAIWEMQSGGIVIGTEEQAKERSKDGKIECYFLPIKKGNEVTFEIKTPRPKTK